MVRNLIVTPSYQNLSFTYRKFPDYYYNLKFESPSGAIIEIVLIDTVLLCGQNDHDFLHTQPEPLTAQKDIRVAEDQWTWLEETLRASK